MIDFDRLVSLNKEDPQAFELERQKLLEEFISTLPEDRQQKARAIIWRQDMELRHLSGVERFNQVVAGFWKQVGAFYHSLGGKL